MTAPNRYRPRRPRSQPPSFPRRPRPPRRLPSRRLPPGDGLGTAGLVLGIIALVLAVIPTVGVIAWFIWPVGLVLAVIGFARVRSGEATNRGPALAGVITSGVAAAVCLLGLVITVVGAASTPAATTPVAGTTTAGTPVASTPSFQPSGTVSSVPTTAPLQRATSSAASSTAAASAAALPVGVATSVRDGTYKVGKDIAAGRYKTVGPPTNATIRNCRWQSAKDDSGELGSIISSGDTQGPGSVTVKAGEYFQTAGGCTWTKQ